MRDLWMCVGTILAIQTSIFAQTNVTEFRSSNFDLTPAFVKIHSPNTVNFLCVNHDESDSPLQVSSSKNISSKEIEIFTKILNKTSVHIRMEVNDYVGIFHLLCYIKGEQSHGTRADVIITAAPGVLQLLERCRVYDRQFIKCVIRAPTIARAIENGYPATFEFEEINHSGQQLVYNPRVEFLRNESTSGTLVFKWKPMVDGTFPDGLRMRMKAILPYFNVSIYYFDLTPVFRITPIFISKAISSNEIKIELSSISPLGLCEKSIQEKSNPKKNQMWTIIEANRHDILIDNLRSNSKYAICIRCREALSDPDGIEQCQEIKTWNRLSFMSGSPFRTAVISIVLSIIFGVLLFFFVRHQRRPRYVPIDPGPKSTNPRTSNMNVYHDGSQAESNHSLNSNKSTGRVSANNDPSDSHMPIGEANDSKYIRIASLDSVINMCNSPRLLELSNSIPE